MNLRLIVNYIGKILCVEAVLMLPAVIIAIVCGEMHALGAFGVTMAVTFLTGVLLTLIKVKQHSLFAREGFVIVSLSWIALSLFGALPFFLSDAIPSYLDSLFETVSGFTTTGASILTEVESLPYSLLYWRSFTHWVGGMGVLVFMLAILPVSRGSGDSVRLMQAESPGPVVGKLVPTVRRTARILYSIYIALTVLMFILLLCGGMPVFDSIVNAFATAGTGGFGIKNASYAAYDSYYLQTVTAVFMLLFGVNFNIYHLVLLRDFRGILRNEELRLYLIVIVASTVLIAFNTHDFYTTGFDSLHHAFFQVASIITTTGFATVDFAQWPLFSRVILVLLMLLGACAGSTGGGFKMERILILLKSVKNQIQKLIHPRAVRAVRVNSRAIDEKTISSVSSYLSIYLIISIVSVLILAIDNYSFETATSAVIACFNNIGPGLDAVGPMSNYSKMTVLSKTVLILDMLFGRLEIYPMLLLFVPSTWKKSR